MRLATYFDEGPTVGLVEGSEIWNLRELVSRYLFETEHLPDSRAVAAALVPHDMASFIRLNASRLNFFNDAYGYMSGHKNEVDDIAAALETLRGQGLRLIDETPRQGVHGLVAFIHPKATHGTMIELLQRH